MTKSPFSIRKSDFSEPSIRVDGTRGTHVVKLERRMNLYVSPCHISIENFVIVHTVEYLFLCIVCYLSTVSTSHYKNAVTRIGGAARWLSRTYISYLKFL